MKKITPLYVEEINMLEGLEDTKLEAYLDENPRIIPLFEIDVLEATSKYISTRTLNEDEYEPELESVLELSRAREAFEREMEISRIVIMSALEDINVGSAEAPRLVSIAKDLTSSEKRAMTELLRELIMSLHDRMKT
mgnify:CR=1 FL=1